MVDPEGSLSHIQQRVRSSVSTFPTSPGRRSSISSRRRPPDSAPPSLWKSPEPKSRLTPSKNSSSRNYVPCWGGARFGISGIRKCSSAALARWRWRSRLPRKRTQASPARHLRGYSSPWTSPPWGERCTCPRMRSRRSKRSECSSWNSFWRFPPRIDMRAPTIRRAPNSLTIEGATRYEQVSTEGARNDGPRSQSRLCLVR